MNHSPTSASLEHNQRNDYRSYVVGFVLSALLTLGSYFVVTRGLLTGQAALLAVGGLAALQFVVQLLCFLHLGGERKPRWKLIVFWFMIMTVFIVIAGSIWIMNNLSYNMGSGSDLDTYMRNNEDL